MKAIFLLVTASLLTGCLEEKTNAPQPTQCFDILQGKDTVRPIMFNRCTGETWMLVYTTLFTDGKPTGEFTYRWAPLISTNGEPHLSYRD